MLHEFCQEAVEHYAAGKCDAKGIYEFAQGRMIAADLNEEQMTSVNWCLHRVAETIESHHVTGVWTEEYVTIRQPDGGVVNFGSADLILFYNKGGKKYAILIDYKFGRVKVDPAPTNRQGHSYAIALLQSKDCQDVEAVTVRFLQPRIGYDTEAMVQRNEVPDYYDSIVQLIDDASMPNPPKTPCKACAYCKFADEGSCEALANMTAIASRCEDLPMPPTFEEGLLEHPQDFAKAYWCMKKVEPYFYGIKKKCLELAEAGEDMSFMHNGEFVEFVVAYSKSKRELGNAGEIFEALEGTLSPEQLMACAEIRVTKLEDVYGNIKVDEYKESVTTVKAEIQHWKDVKKKAKKEKDSHNMAQADYHGDNCKEKMATLKEFRITKANSKESLEQILSAEGLITRSDAKIAKIIMKTKQINKEIE